MAEKETVIQNAICSYLATRTDLMFWVSKNASTYDATRGCFRKLGKWQKRGVPDLTAVLDDGRMLLIEVKTKTGRLSQHQKEFHEQAREMGALVIVARCVEDVQKGLDAGMCGDIGPI
jgi:hypothetical protein